MACASCGNTSGIGSALSGAKQTHLNSGCSYTLEQVQEWQRLLFCIKHNSYFEQVDTDVAEVMGALGIVMSAINYQDQICYFKFYLDKVSPLIIRIVNAEVCL